MSGTPKLLPAALAPVASALLPRSSPHPMRFSAGPYPSVSLYWR